MIHRLLAAVADWLNDRWDIAFDFDAPLTEEPFTDKPQQWHVPDALTVRLEPDDEWPKLGERGYVVTEDGYYPIQVTEVQPNPEGVRYTIESAREDE